MKWIVKGTIVQTKVYDENHQLFALINQSILNGNETRVKIKNIKAFKIFKIDDTFNIYQDNALVAKAYFIYDQTTQNKILRCIKTKRVEQLDFNFDKHQVILKQTEDRLINIGLNGKDIGQLSKMLSFTSYICINDIESLPLYLFVLFYVLGRYMVFADEGQFI